jgi:hypothetical protein
MSIAPNRQERRAMAKANETFPRHLVRIKPEAWPTYPPRLAEVWRSRGFLVQVFAEDGGIFRLSVCRTMHNGESWVDQISWEELMQCKRECGRGGLDAVEVYPADADIVNVANMRHLWVLPEPVAFAWRKH